MEDEYDQILKFMHCETVWFAFSHMMAELDRRMG